MGEEDETQASIVLNFICGSDAQPSWKPLGYTFKGKRTTNSKLQNMKGQYNRKYVRKLPHLMMYTQL